MHQHVKIMVLKTLDWNMPQSSGSRVDSHALSIIKTLLLILMTEPVLIIIRIKIIAYLNYKV